MPTIDRGDFNLSYRVAGTAANGPAALLIHGLGANMAYWHPLLVRRLGEGRRLVMFDLRGHGYSGLPPSGYTSADMAEDAQALLDELAIERVALVAHSFGTAVALQLLRAAPQRITSLIVLDGRVRLLQPMQRLRDWKHFERWWPHFEAAGVRVDADQELDFSLLSIIAEEQFAEVRRGLEADGFFVPFGLFNGGRRAAAKWRKLMAETTAAEDFKATAGLTPDSLSAIAVPVLAVYGEYSHCLPTRDALMQRIAGCQCATVPGVGHNFPILRPEETADLVRRFWAERTTADLLR